MNPMIEPTTLLILFLVVVAEVLIIKRLKAKSTVLLAALLFAVNVLLIIGLIGSFQNITQADTLTSSMAVDSLVSFNGFSTKVRNSLVLVGLLFLSYGLFDQYQIRKNRRLLILSLSIAGLTILLLILMILAGGFII